jgi:exonuclease I
MWLQIFIYLQVFAMGILAAAAAYYARAHFSSKSTPQPAQEEHQPALVTVDLPHDVRERLVAASQKQFTDILGTSTTKLQQDLGVTTGHINNLVLRLASEIVSGELERYREDLSKLHEQAQASMGGISQEVAKHEEEVKAKISQELEAEKQRLLAQIDTRLGDAVGSFLLEALGKNVDLGGQNAYLAQLLEEHKEEFKKEVAGNG